MWHHRGHEKNPEHLVTAERLVEVLWHASLPATIDNDGDLLVVMDDGLELRVSIPKDCPWLRFRATRQLREDASELDKLRLLNTLNEQSLAIRFAMPQRETLDTSCSDGLLR